MLYSLVYLFTVLPGERGIATRTWSGIEEQLLVHRHDHVSHVDGASYIDMHVGVTDYIMLSN